MDPVVIIGTGLAGYTLARELRKLDRETPLVLISADDGGFYSKPMLSNALAAGKTPAQLLNKAANAMALELSATLVRCEVQSTGNRSRACGEQRTGVVADRFSARATRVPGHALGDCAEVAGSGALRSPIMHRPNASGPRAAGTTALSSDAGRLRPCRQSPAYGRCNGRQAGGVARFLVLERAIDFALPVPRAGQAGNAKQMQARGPTVW